MRRLLAVLVCLFGMALAFGYPMLTSRLPPVPMGTWQVFAPVSGFQAVEAKLRPEDAPVEVYVDLSSAGTPKFAGDRAVLTLTASTAGKTALAVPLTFEGAAARDDAPQTAELIYRTKAGVIEAVDSTAAVYTFTTGFGDAEAVDIARVDLVLERGRQKADPRAAPVGMVAMAIGAVAFLLSFRKADSPPPNPNQQPPARRWGRSAADRR